jgi:hypothetical protein
MNTASAFIGAEFNPTGNPIGGGPGYSDSVTVYDYYVTSKAELINALSSAGSGDIIYVADDAEIDMSGEPPQNIPEGVTLASGRGRTLSNTISWGGLIYLNDTDGRGDNPLFRFIYPNARITGLRFRGSYSDMEGGRPGTDTFPNNHIKEECIRIAGSNADFCEVDNCEIWGFTVALNSREGEGGYFHHNYIHNNNHGNGGGYGTNNGGNGKVIIEANLVDWHSGPIVGSGINSENSYYEARWNYILDHGYHNTFDRHGTNEGGSPNYAPPVSIHHNTTRARYFLTGNVTGVWIRGTPLDSCLIYNNWFWDDDSASSIHLYQDILTRISDNHFGTTLPAGVSGRIPTANIVAGVDSGTVPLTVTFKATGSYDPDGNIRAYYWKFGEDVYARYTDISDSVQHTFDEIGIYRVELMVTDDHGIPAEDYYDIKVKPISDSNYLSVWVKDRWHGSETGYYTKQILIDDWIAWEEDVAGDEGWEHIIINVTDSIVGKDSITITLRLCCGQDNGDGLFRNLWVYWDDIALYGADVKNGNFESDENWVYWGGTMSGDNWKCSKDGTWLSGYIVSREVRSGITGFYTGNQYGYDTYQGEWIAVEQKVAVGNLGISSSGQGNTFYCLSSPYPNPSRHGSAIISYQLSAKSAVTLKIYDICGRVVRTLVDDENEAGSYLVNWDGNAERGKRTASGVYFYKFVVNPCGIANPAGETSQYSETKKLVVLR